MKNILFTLALIFGVLTNSYSQTGLTNADDFNEIDLYGNTIHLSSILDGGQWVVINFGAYWCGPCMTLASDFGQVYQEYGCNTGEVFLIELEYEGTNQQCQDFINSYGDGYDVPYVCNSYDVFVDYDIQAFPTVILINPDGEIVEQDIWPVDYDILTNLLYSYGLNPTTCDNTIGIDELEKPKGEHDIIYDLLGRSWNTYDDVPLGIHFIMNGEKLIKLK